MVAAILALALVGPPLAGGVPQRVGAPGGCKDGGPHRGPGRFAVWVFCEDALAVHIGVVYAAQMGIPIDGAWSLTDRFWQEPRWGADVNTFAWSPDGASLFVSTSGVYGTGGLFRLDLLDRKVHSLLPENVETSVEILGVASDGVRYRLTDLTSLAVRQEGVVASHRPGPP